MFLSVCCCWLFVCCCGLLRAYMLVAVVCLSAAWCCCIRVSCCCLLHICVLLLHACLLQLCYWWCRFLCAVDAYLRGVAVACLSAVTAVCRLGVAFVWLCAVYSLRVVVCVCVFLICMCVITVVICLWAVVVCLCYFLLLCIGSYGSWQYASCISGCIVRSP